MRLPWPTRSPPRRNRVKPAYDNDGGRSSMANGDGGMGSGLARGGAL